MKKYKQEIPDFLKLVFVIASLITKFGKLAWLEIVDATGNLEN
jgi:hypothetical protein